MAVLNTIRSWTWALIVFVGVAMFAFIAGDAWKMIQPHTIPSAGVVDGEKLSYNEYQRMVEELTDVYKMQYQTNSFNDQQMNAIRDEVWNTYVNDKLIKRECDKLGIEVNDAELLNIVKTGNSQLLQQSPFINPQTHRYDYDVLTKFLSYYDNAKKQGFASQNASYLIKQYTYWKYIEKKIKTTALSNKYFTLLSAAMLGDSIQARDAYNAQNLMAEVVVSGLPYSTIADSTITVSDAALQAKYNEMKENFRRPQDTRTVKYIDVQVRPSAADRAAINEDVDKAIQELAPANAKLVDIVTNAQSSVLYKDLFLAASALPTDVATRLKDVKVGDTFGPYEDAQTNTVNGFKVVAKEKSADSIAFRQVFVADADKKVMANRTDSILNVLKKGGDFEKVAQALGQQGKPAVITSAMLAQSPQLNADQENLIKTVYSMKQGELKTITLGQANVILEVTAKAVVTDRYKVAIIKRPIEFSDDTYQETYTAFSQFVAENKTIADMEKNAEDAGYRVRTTMVSPSSHYIANVPETAQLVKWSFENDINAVSELEEVGNNDQFMICGLTAITPAGYASFDDVKQQLRFLVIRDLKAEQLKKQLEGKTTIAAVSSMPEAVTDTLKRVTFSDTPQVAGFGYEPNIAAYASAAQKGAVSKPVQGLGGVYLVQVVDRKQGGLEYNAKTQMNTIAQRKMMMLLNQRTRQPNFEALREGVDIQDTRYLFYN
ncbi:MAG TPA: SurA N-terminal domain-containing protein [Bacteroidaceae bacterium]|nr:SurA N-terminal domain-containing protein [Bacteroidaceae bacterium]